MQHIHFVTKQYGIRGVIKTQSQMNCALDGMVDRHYEQLTDVVQANGLYHKWKAQGWRFDDYGFFIMGFVRLNSRDHNESDFSVQTMAAIAHQIEKDVE